MTYRGDFDPADFDQSNTATWPTPAPYTPGDWWYLTGPGTIDGRVVDVGWRVFPVGTGRLYGEDRYGDGVIGGAVPDPPWIADPLRVRWSAMRWADAPAWQRPPGPYDGCPFGETGWRIVVQVLGLNPNARLYGTSTFGTGNYGDTVDSDWIDVSHTTYGAVVDRGGTDGRPLIDVESGDLELFDVDADLFPLVTTGDTVDGVVRSPTVGAPVRVALLDPAGDPHPMFTGRIEQITDRADRPPRDVQIAAYGMAADLVTTIGRLSRSAENVAVRIAALVAASEYSWGIDLPTSPVQLRRIDPADDAQVRAEVDRAALSAGLVTRNDALGVIGFVPWPIEPSLADAVTVGDRLDVQTLPASNVVVIADRTELLNAAYATTEAVQGAPELTATTASAPSIARFGRSTQTLGFPVDGLSAPQTVLDTLVADAVDRYGAVVHRVEQITVDTSQDRRWLAVLADLDLGDTVIVNLSEPITRSYTAIVVGAQIRITPGRIVADLHLSTTDQTQ